ncbi:HK97-gp10 family putative phage morphogenesis protein [Lacticaseibacillus sp. GG6-2]
MSSQNGFEMISKQLTAMNVSEKVGMEGLANAAKAYADKLTPVLPSDPNAPLAKEYGSLKDQLRVVNKEDHVQVTFGDAFWWLFLEHGTASGIRPYNFVHNTFETNKDELKRLMVAPTMAALKK